MQSNYISMDTENLKKAFPLALIFGRRLGFLRVHYKSDAKMNIKFLVLVLALPFTLACALGQTVPLITSSTASAIATTVPSYGSSSSGLAGSCPDFIVSSDHIPGDPEIFIRSDATLWEAPSLSSKVIKKLNGSSDKQLIASFIDGPRCYTEPTTGCNMTWNEVSIDGVTGWTTVDTPCYPNGIQP